MERGCHPEHFPAPCLCPHVKACWWDVQVDSFWEGPHWSLLPGIHTSAIPSLWITFFSLTEHLNGGDVTPVIRLQKVLTVVLLADLPLLALMKQVWKAHMASKWGHPLANSQLGNEAFSPSSKRNRVLPRTTEVSCSSWALRWVPSPGWHLDGSILREQEAEDSDKPFLDSKQQKL